MKTSVKQTYSSSYNQSVTKKGGRITRFTVWRTGVPGSTQTVKVPKK